ncbi:aldehyde dehydrogenase [Rossellomorea vietnamensis]|uniref:aldehyde dehydrogenase n=1 Tax=Rossellomorea vietnamensis TaxID=218284 RepID=UPI001CCB6F4F|nr:aldehyde dehydrogenase [Rossellomorea vietnamensis]MCA0150855.1 aldehyde dehydrogenase [Rossellomorea vietnamensis]
MSTELFIEEASLEAIEASLQQHKQFFKSGVTRPLQYRKDLLEKFSTVIKNHETEIISALKKDLNKSDMEAYTTEIGILLEEIRFVLKNIDEWAEPKKMKTAKTHIGSKAYTVPEPYGVTLIIAPWNYPIQLALAPVIGAIAAGNTAIIKPSELTPTTSALLAQMINTHFDPRQLFVIEGGVETTQNLLKQGFDYIFFTGSVPVGKVVMEAAAKQLIPVTLELGGKSPCIVDETADIPLAAKRIAFGKVTNAGQTCIAPDYLFIHKSKKDEFITEFKKTVIEFYGTEPLKSDKFGRIVNERHFNRLTSYLEDGEILLGGNVDPACLKIEPTLMEPRDFSVPVMQDEIFGPVFPVIEYEDLDEVIEFVTGRPKPLALYLFTENPITEEKINGSISYGGGCVNDTLMHIVTPYLPFGGVGESGIGNYHGESSFSTFSHYKSILKQTTKFDMSFRYPSGRFGLRIIKKLLK